MRQPMGSDRVGPWDGLLYVPAEDVREWLLAELRESMCATGVQMLVNGEWL